MGQGVFWAGYTHKVAGSYEELSWTFLTHRHITAEGDEGVWFGLWWTDAEVLDPADVSLSFTFVLLPNSKKNVCQN